MVNKGYTKKEVLDVLFESEQEKESRRILAIVTKTVDALRLKNNREFLAYQQLATWRRMNDFDRVEGEESCFHGHRSLPPTPQEYYAGLWSEVNALEESISMPAEDTATRPRQKDSLDELLANFEFARIKEYVEKRSREAVQLQLTVTQLNTVQHSSPYPLDLEPSPSVNVELENAEGKMGPELEELELPSAGTGLETPGQQCPPNEAVGSSQGEIIPPTTECVDTRTSEKSTKITADTTFLQQGHKTFSEQNKQFDPGGKREKAPPWKAAVALLSFSGESGKAPCLFSVCASCSVLCVCLCFPKLFFYPGDHFSAKLKDMSGDADKSLMYATGGQAFSRLPPS